MICYQDGIKICCDGEGCEQVADFPIAVTPKLSRPELSAKGWLFARKNNEHRHYCPDCTAKKLAKDTKS